VRVLFRAWAAVLWQGYESVRQGWELTGSLVQRDLFSLLRGRSQGGLKCKSIQGSNSAMHAFETGVLGQHFGHLYL